MFETEGTVSGTQVVLRVTEDRPEGWLHLLSHLYPVVHVMSWEAIAETLLVAHKYNMAAPLTACTEWILSQPFTAILDSSSYALWWLEMGERLHIDSIRDKGMAFIKSELIAGRKAIFADRESMVLLSQQAQSEIISLIATAHVSCGPKWKCSSCKFTMRLGAHRSAPPGVQVPLVQSHLLRTTSGGVIDSGWHKERRPAP